MEWLRCNKCYRQMNKSNRTYSLTQCGHLYCSRCMADVSAKCTICGAQNFKTMTLSGPPKLEMQHFFRPVEEFIEKSIKIEAFQNDQLSVVARGFEEIEKKYETLKKMYWNGMKEMNLLMQTYAKLEVETAELKKIREALLKAREENNDKPQSSSSSFSRYTGGYQNKRNWGNFFTSNKSEKGQVFHVPGSVENDQHTQKYQATKNVPEKSKLQIPERQYDQSTPYFSRVIDSKGYETADSGRWSIPASSSSRMGIFRVPSVQKVPKSAASLKKRSPML